MSLEKKLKNYLLNFYITLQHLVRDFSSGDILTEGHFVWRSFVQLTILHTTCRHKFTTLMSQTFEVKCNACFQNRGISRRTNNFYLSLTNKFNRLLFDIYIRASIQNQSSLRSYLLLGRNQGQAITPKRMSQNRKQFTTYQPVPI